MVRKINKLGFTLLELLIVMVIVGLVAVISLPAFTGLNESARIHEDLNKMSAFIKSARIWAFTHKQEVEVTLGGVGRGNMYLESKTTTTPPVNTNERLNINYAYTTSVAGPIAVTTRGTMSGMTITLNDPSENPSGQEDSLVISTSRVLID